MNNINSDLTQLDKHLTELQNTKNAYQQLKSSKIASLTNLHSQNLQEINTTLSYIEHKESTLIQTLNKKKNKIIYLNTNILSLQKQIDALKDQLTSSNLSHISQLQLTISNIEHEIQRITTKQNKRKSILHKLKRKALEHEENKQMLHEEFLYCKHMLIVLTSKIESHSEFIKNLLKNKNTLTTSLEQLNMTLPEYTPVTASEINVVKPQKLGESLYSYANEYLKFVDKRDKFIQEISTCNNFDEVVTYLTRISTYKLTPNLFEYLLIALCRILSYENVLDLRIAFVNELNESNDEHNDNGSSNNNSKRLATFKEDKEETILQRVKKDENKLAELIKQKEQEIKQLTEITSMQNENEKTIHDMQNDIASMIQYKESLYNECKSIEKQLGSELKNAEDKINKLKQINKELHDKIVSKKQKLLLNENKFNSEIESITLLKNRLISNKQQQQQHMNVNVNVNNVKHNIPSSSSSSSKTYLHKVDTLLSYIPEFKYPSSTPEKHLLLTQTIAPLLTGATVLKRQILNANKLIYETFSPINSQNKHLEPFDYGFNTFYLYVNKDLSQLVFQKTNPLSHTLQLSLTSLSHIEIPDTTQNLLFINKLVNSLNKKLQLKSSSEINAYFDNNKENIISLYKKDTLKTSSKLNNHDHSSNTSCNTTTTNFNLNLFNKEYRNALIQSKTYLVYIYIKPNNVQKVEIIFDSSTRFKQWINGLNALINDYTYTKDTIAKYLLI